MNFGLLVSHLPHVKESRSHYNAMLSLHNVTQHRLATLWNGLKARLR
jgi:hypothetical protein